MSNRVVVVAVVLASACSAEDAPPIECGVGTELNPTGDTCVPVPPALISCGVGTHLVGQTCVPNGEVRYELRVFDPMIAADGLTKVPVLAIGRNADGTPANEPVLLSVSRAGAGAFPEPRVQLKELGVVTYFRPCSSTQVGCLGPVTLELSRVLDPSAPVASLDVQLVERAGGSAPVNCLTGGNVMFLDGEDDIYSGVLQVRDGGWGVRGKRNRLRLRIDPVNQNQGKWRIELSTERRSDDLVPGVYEMAQKVNREGEGRAGLDVAHEGRQCSEVDGRFEIHDYQVVDDVVQRATISFDQRCAGATRRLRGCVHYVRDAGQNP